MQYVGITNMVHFVPYLWEVAFLPTYQLFSTLWMTEFQELRYLFDASSGKPKSARVPTLHFKTWANLS